MAFVFTDEFKPILRKARRNNGFELGTGLAFSKAKDLGVNVYRKKKPKTKVRKQKGGMDYMGFGLDLWD